MTCPAVNHIFGNSGKSESWNKHVAETVWSDLEPAGFPIITAKTKISDLHESRKGRVLDVGPGRSGWFAGSA
jgi:hypothetical protein